MMDRVTLADYLREAESYKGKVQYLAYGAVVKAVCDRHGITVDYDDTHIIVMTDNLEGIIL